MSDILGRRIQHTHLDDLRRALELGAMLGDRVEASLKQLRTMPQAMATIFAEAGNRPLKHSQVRALTEIAKLEDAREEIAVAQECLLPLPVHPCDIMTDGVTRTFIREFKAGDYKTGNQILHILTDIAGIQESKISPAVIALLKSEGGSPLCKATIALVIWYQMSYQYTQAAAQLQKSPS